MIDESDFSKLPTRSVAGVLSNIPGLQVESNDTDGYSAISVRGLPLTADGAKYLQIQEDGMPVLEFADSADFFLRTDLSLAQVQAIRGGSASTFASNSPAGVVNFISKTGEHKGGTIQLSSGLGYDLKRLDFEYGSPLGDGWRFHVGGFYHEGEGVRKVGYTAVRGGQIKANLTKEFAGGYIRLYGKYLNDRQPDYQSSPLSLTGTNANPIYGSLPNVDPLKYGLYPSNGNGHYLNIDQNNAPAVMNGQNGLHGISKAVGVESQFDLSGWTVTERFRYSSNSGELSQIAPLFVSTAGTVAAVLGAPGGTLSYADGGLAGWRARRSRRRRPSTATGCWASWPASISSSPTTTMRSTICAPAACGMWARAS